MQKQHAAEPVSLNALAKILGRSKSGLHYLEKRGHIKRNLLGKFDIAEVQRAIATTVDQAKAHRRKAPNSPDVRTRAISRSNKPGMVRLDGKWVTIEQATAERDRYLALLAELIGQREAARKAGRPFVPDINEDDGA